MIERFRAALRLLAPDDITPTGRRVLEQILDDEEEQAKENTDDLVMRMAGLLTLTANALKGDPAPLQVHDWSDLPTVAADLVRRLEACEADAKEDPR